MLPAGTAAVLVDGPGGQRQIVAGRLAAALKAAGRPGLVLAGLAGRAGAVPAMAT